MAQVEIARFADEDNARLAVDFLRRHGLVALTPSQRTGWTMRGSNAIGEATVFVDAAQADLARELLIQAVRGDFDDADSSGSSKRSLGAALAEAVNPKPGFRNPSVWVRLAPFVAIPVLLLLGFIGRMAFERLAS